MGSYNPLATSTPTLDNLAKKGILFEQAIAQGHATQTAMPTVLSGCYPSTFDDIQFLAEKRPRCSSVIQSIKYQTAAFISNPYITEDYGYGTGFDYFDDCYSLIKQRIIHKNTLLLRGFNRIFGRIGLGVECPPYPCADIITNRVRAWISKNREPFFIWIHYMDAHIPYGLRRCSLLLPGGLGQRPYRYGYWRHLIRGEKKVSSEEIALANWLYEEGINYIDRQIKRLVRTVNNNKYRYQTTFIVTADHGEEFYDHGFFGHRNHIYEESIHVPLIIYTTDSNQQGYRITNQVRHLDLAPTIIELAGGEPHPEMEGVSLVPIMQGEKITRSLPAISQSDSRKNWHLSLREPPYKLILYLEARKNRIINMELYNLQDDPHECINLVDVKTVIVQKMKHTLEKHISHLDLASEIDHQKVHSDLPMKERFEALGYLEES
jgi:arylsulfatase